MSHQQRSRWVDAESFYGYPRGYWLTYTCFLLLVAVLYANAAIQNKPGLYVLPLAVAYAIGWGHGIVMEGHDA